MKKIYTYYLMLVATLTFGQQEQTPTGPEITADLPSVSPPSPTVAGLMKFEEIPVSNYTGVPDISIPLFNTSTRSKDIGVDVTLKYHPSDLMVDNVASWAGVCWSLDAGGTISRTVMGSPDDLQNNGKGIYSSQNNFEYIFYYNLGNYTPEGISFTQPQRKEFIWDAYEKDKYDTEYDIYQFSFMGHSGRFYIKKDGTIVKLFNDVAMQINYDAVNKVFTLYDDKGYKFVFDVLENSTEYKMISQSMADGTMGNPVLPQSPGYISAFHLSAIYDRNNKLLVSYEYSSVNEVIDRIIETTNEYIPAIPVQSSLSVVLGPQCYNEPNNLTTNLQACLPSKIATYITTTYATKKLSKIDIKGKGKVEFITESGRQDLNSDAIRLKGVQVKDSIGNLVKDYELVHSYLGAGKRLVLQTVKQKDTQSATALNYQLKYNNIQNLPLRTSKDKDWWGYFNNSSNLPSGLNSENNPTYCTTGVLQQIINPTGGSVVFGFESNQYSYEGTTSLTKFDNPQNWVPQTVQKNYSGYNSANEQSYIYFNLPTDQTAKLTLATSGFSPIASKNYWYFQIIPVQTVPPVTLPDGSQVEWNQVSSYTVDNSRPIFNIKTIDLDATLASNYYVYNKYLKSGAYIILFSVVPTGPPAPANGGTYALTLNYNRLSDTYKYVNGGGLRIKYIGYFKDQAQVDPGYYAIINSSPNFEYPVPEHEKKYNYNNFDDQLRSSGSLCYAKPVYKYKITKSTLFVCTIINDKWLNDWDYWVTNNFNSLNPVKTQGADIGYKYVTVTDNRRSFAAQTGPLDTTYTPNDNADLGRTEYTYTSPIDYPANGYSITYPFKNLNRDYDYKRGLLLKQKQYDKSNKALLETTLVYNIVEDTTFVSGVRMFSQKGCGYSVLWPNYVSYHSAETFPNCENINPHPCHDQCGDVMGYMGYYPKREAFGWAQLISQNTKQYYYNSDNTLQGTKETTDSYTYNTANKKLQSQTKINSLSETELINYYYVNYANNQIADIDHIESKKNGSFVNTSKIIYNNAFTGNSSYLPSYIQTATGDQPLENRVQFVKYDKFSNALETKKSNGSSVSYIYGYNQSIPIAKIENSTYAAISSSLITAAQTASNGTDETALLTALNNIRTTLPNALITTYTYKPLLGVSTITDPKGIKITYSYDGFGRLKEVRDQYSNLLSQNEYHYKP